MRMQKQVMEIEEERVQELTKEKKKMSGTK